MKRAVYIFALILGLTLALNSCAHKKRTGNYNISLKIKPENLKGPGDIKEISTIINKRLIEYGIPEKNITISDNNGIINLEVKQADELDRIIKLITAQGELGFWETYELSEVYSSLEKANKKAAELLKDSIIPSDGNKYTKEIEIPADTSSLISKSQVNLKNRNNLNAKEFAAYKKDNPLFAYLQPEIENINGEQQLKKGCVVGSCEIKDTAYVNKILKMPEVKLCFPRYLKLLWDSKAFDNENKFIKLNAIKDSRDGKATLTGDVLTEVSYFKSNTYEISLAVNHEGAMIWKRMTAENLGKCIAIVLDGQVYSCPVVQNEIKEGKSNITGNFTEAEAEDLTTILKAGMLPFRITIIDSKISTIN
jgi:SecD/SecF fusion protein